MHKTLDLLKEKNEFENEIGERLKSAVSTSIKHPVNKFILAKTESYITPFCVVVCTNSEKQIDAITTEIIKNLKEQGLFATNVRIDGNAERGWCTIDLGDCFFNLITEEKLAFYKLEDIISGKAHNQ